MINYIIIGAVLGSVLGLSGSGGAIIGIPLIMWMLHVDLKAASALVLPIVGIAAAMQWLPQRRLTQWPIVFSVILPLIISSAMSGFLRTLMPDLAIKALLGLFVVWGLWSTWFSKKTVIEVKQTVFLLKSTALGLLGGVVTTLTGLGGGLLLVPLLKQGFGLKIDKAVSTSLMMIILTCGVAMMSLYYHDQLITFSAAQLGSIIVGSFGVSLVIKWILQQGDKAKVQIIQKWIYTFVLTGSILGIVFLR